MLPLLRAVSPFTSAPFNGKRVCVLQIVYFVYVYVKLPVGTDPAKTNVVMMQVEKKVNSVLGDSNKLVKSMINYKITKSIYTKCSRFSSRRYFC